MILVESWKKYLTELESVQGLESSFQMKDSLQPEFWKEDDVLDSDIADRLYEIAKDFKVICKPYLLYDSWLYLEIENFKILN